MWALWMAGWLGSQGAPEQGAPPGGQVHDPVEAPDDEAAAAGPRVGPATLATAVGLVAIGTGPVTVGGLIGCGALSTLAYDPANDLRLPAAQKVPLIIAAAWLPVPAGAAALATVPVAAALSVVAAWLIADDGAVALATGIGAAVAGPTGFGLGLLGATLLAIPLALVSSSLVPDPLGLRGGPVGPDDAIGPLLGVAATLGAAFGVVVGAAAGGAVGIALFGGPAGAPPASGARSRE